jgi:Helix-turn-helix.
MEIRRKLNRIKEVLDARGTSQTWLAKQLNKDFSTINAYCGQRQQPNLATLFRISEILGCKYQDLIADPYNTTTETKTENGTNLR